MCIKYAITLQEIFPSGWLHYILVLLALFQICSGSAQVREVYLQPGPSESTYFVEQVPLPSTLQGFNAFSIFQDRKGFMWFGGESSLLRYDGSRIREFKYNPNDPNSIKLSGVNAIAQDSSGIIWLGAWSGLISLDPATSSFTRYHNSGGGDPTWEWNCVNEMVLDTHQLWLATQRGFCRFDLYSHTFDRHVMNHNPKASGEGNMTMSVSRCMDDELFIRFGPDLYIYCISADSVRQVRGSPPSNAIPLIDRSGNIFCPSWSGINTYDHSTGTFEKMSVHMDTSGTRPGCVRRVLQDKEGFYWMSTDKGIARFTETWEPEAYWKYEFKKFLEDNYQEQLRAMYLDRDEILWYSTPGEIGRIIRTHPSFSYEERPPMDRYIFHLAVNDSCLWFTGEKYLFKLHFKRPGYSQYRIEPVPGEDDTFPMNSYFLFDRRDNLWLGTKNAGIFLCENIASEKPTFSHFYPGTGKGLQNLNKHILNIYEDAMGRVWFGIAFSWPCYVDQKTNHTIHVVPDPEIEWSPGEVKIEADLGSGWYLASTRSGALLFSLLETDEKKDTVFIKDFEFYMHHSEGTTRSNMPLHMLVSRNENGETYVYVVSDAGGIQRFRLDLSQKKGNKLVKNLEINTNNGLLVNRFHGIVEDKNGIIYFTSENGMVRLDPQINSFTTYTRDQGLGFDEFGARAVAVAPDDRIYLGTDHGIVYFHPDSIVLNKNQPPVLITDVKVNGISLQKDSITSVSFFDRARFKLSYKQKNLLFEFAALNYIHPERNHFKIMLEGNDEKWISVGNESNYAYYNLNPGKYSFHVIGSNNDDVWNMTGDRFDFIIKKPPWFTWGALLIYIAILSAIFVTYYRYVQYRSKVKMEIARERLEKTTLAEVDEMKSRFFANISHEFRTPLTLIMGYVRDLEVQKGRNEVRMKRSALAVLGRNARRLLLLINQLLDIAKLEKNALQLDLKKGDLSEWTRVLVSSFQSLADSQEIQFTTKIEDPGKEVCFDPDKTDKIITNLLSNAFKFTGKGGKIAFQLQYREGEKDDQEQAEIIVSDTGKGMDEDELTKIFDRFYQVSSSNARDVEGAGIGLSLTRELVELLKGKITVESEPGKGTTFRVRMPVTEKCYPGQVILTTDIPRETHRQLVSDEGIPGGRIEGQGSREHENVILVVEDNTDLRKYLADQLSGSYSVLEAANGEKGLELAKKVLPDLVISDLMMPVMDGIAMLERLKQDQATNHIPVIMLTAKADKESKLEGLETGADDYIIKPFESEELIARVSNLIRQREMLRNKFTQNYLLGTDRAASTVQFRMLRDILVTIDQHLGDPDFNVSTFGKVMGMTRSQMFRKVHSITGTSPNELVRLVRMKRAAHLFRTTDQNVTQVMYEIGMKNPSHFARTFRKYFGVNPARYRDHD